CIFVLADWAFDAWFDRRWTRVFIFGLYSLAFLANLMYVVSSRTALVTLPIAMLAYCGKRFGWKGILGACVAGAVLLPITWVTSSYLQQRVHDIVDELQQYENNN